MIHNVENSRDENRYLILAISPVNRVS
jgi:hypothetical protein